MKSTIQICLFANLKPFSPDNADNYPIDPGVTVEAVLQKIGVPLETAKLIFIDGKKAGMDHELNGGERVGVFPPVAGG